MLRRACITVLLLLSSCDVLVAAGTPALWLDVPYVKQEKDGCGAASIAMVMQYWRQQQHQPASPNVEYGHIQSALYSPAAHGIYASAMQRYLQQNGFAAFAFTGDWAALKHHLEKGRPMIVALNPGGHSPLHYVVVAGLNEEDQLVLVNDPAQRKLLKENIATFEQEWKATGHWTLLAVPAERSR